MFTVLHSITIFYMPQMCSEERGPNIYGVYGGYNLYRRQNCVICFGFIAYVPRHGDYICILGLVCFS